MSWQTVPLGDICDVIGGGTPSKSRADFYEGDIPWASIRDMQGDWVESTEFSITRKAVASSATNVIPAGNVIIATRVGLGKVARLRRDTAINQDIRAVVPRDDKMLDKQYLFYWFKSIAKIIESEGKGATVKGVTLPFVKSLQLPLPTLPEQHRIVALLDEAFAGIAIAKANAERNIQNVSALFDSRIQSLLAEKDGNWIATTLGACTGGVFTGPFGSLLHKHDYIAGGIPLVNPAHITDIGIVPDMRKTVSEETARRLSSYILREGDVVIGRRGEMGRCALVTASEDGWLCGTGSFTIKSSTHCDPRFLVRFLRSQGCRRELERIAGGAVMPNLSNKDLEHLRIELPPINLQKRIVTELESLDSEKQRLQSTYTRKLAALDELKQSLLQQAFSGQL